MAWFPPDVDPVEHSALVPGIPPWLAAPIMNWVLDSLNNGYGRVDVTLLEKFDIASHNESPLSTMVTGRSFSAAWNNLNVGEQLALIDFLIYSNAGSDWDEQNELLERLLSSGGSEFRVGVRGGNAGLEKRVPQGVVDAAEAIMQTAGAAGALLSEAWHAAFGRDPNPEEAYEKAIKAVEEAGASVVSPNNGRATLGTMIRDMENQGDWCLPLATSDAGVPLAAARALWQGQESRHGGNGYRTPTPEQAEAAVLLAVPLVQWFTSGVLQRRP